MFFLLEAVRPDKAPLQIESGFVSLGEKKFHVPITLEKSWPSGLSSSDTSLSVMSGCCRSRDMNTQVKSGRQDVLSQAVHWQSRQTHRAERKRPASEPSRQTGEPVAAALRAGQRARHAQLTLQLQRGFSCWPVERNNNDWI